MKLKVHIKVMQEPKKTTDNASQIVNLAKSLLHCIDCLIIN